MSKQAYSNANLIAALVEEVNNLHGQLDELKADNAKLRAQVGDACMQLGGAWVRCTELRELLADLAICACGKYCYGCPHQYGGCDRDQRLRELGIEVDE